MHDGLTNPGVSRSFACRLPYEIKSCCRLAALLEVSLLEAAQNVVPVATTAGEIVEKLRTWASGRCLDADRPGLYTRPGSSSDRPGRAVRRADPSAN